MNGFSPELTAALHGLANLRQRRRTVNRRRDRDHGGDSHRSEAGFTTEYVLITALVVVAALTILGIIIAKVTFKAQSIDLG